MNQSTSALQRENKAKDKLTRQIQDEGIDWIAIAIHVGVIMALVLGAVFAHYEASRAQADPMPVLIHAALWLPAVTR